MNKVIGLLLCVVGIAFAEDKKYDIIEESLRRTDTNKKPTADQLNPEDYKTVKEYLDARDRANKDEIMREVILLILLNKR